jgi:hypothetical protein
MNARIRILLFVTTVLTALLVANITAQAAQRTVNAPTSFSPFGPEGPGTFSFPTGVAVNEATGEVFVTDGGSAGGPFEDIVYIFNFEGVMVGSIAGTGSESFVFAQEDAGVAVDNSCDLQKPKLTGSACTAFDPSNEDLYISNVGHSVVDKFKRTGQGTYEFVCQFNGWYGGREACRVNGATSIEPFSEPEEPFSEPLGVTVDVNGDVYTASYGPEDGSLDEFDSAGHGVERISGNTHELLNAHPRYVAVNMLGDIFVSNYEDEGRVVEFSRSGFTGGVEHEGVVLPSTSTIAVDPINNDFYAGIDSGSRVVRYSTGASGELHEEESFGSGVLGEARGLAVDGATNTVYLSDVGHLDVNAFAERPVLLPDLRGGCLASSVTATSATLIGEVDPLGVAGGAFTFEYGLVPYELQAGGSVEGSEYKQVVAEVSGLTPGMRYHCRLSATDSEGLAANIVEYGPDSIFETLPLRPAVDEAAAFATEVTAESAILSGEVNPGNGVTSYHFAYGTEAGHYTQALPSAITGLGFAPIPVKEAITTGALRPGVKYHFALIATNAAGETVGSDQTFTTVSNSNSATAGPSVDTGPAESISQNGATLTGTVVASEGLPTQYGFEFGPSFSYGTEVFGEEIGPEGGQEQVSRAIGGLQPGVAYYYRLVAFNAAGIEYGAYRTFTTVASSTGVSSSTGIAVPASPSILPIPVFPYVKYLPPKKKHARKKGKSPHPRGKKSHPHKPSGKSARHVMHRGRSFR